MFSLRVRRKVGIVRKFSNIIVSAVLLFLPGIALAQFGRVSNCIDIGGIPIPSPFCYAFGPAGQITASGLVFQIIQIALWVVGMLAVLFLIVGGYRYITASGNEEQVEGAKQTIFHAIIGLAIVIMSFVIVRIIANALISGRA